MNRIEEALAAYWYCAYQEGHLGRPDGNKADAILSEIRAGLREAIEAAIADDKQNPWKRVIIDALIVNHILKAQHVSSPEHALIDLITWENTCALDPAISEPASDMLALARAEEREACALVCDHIDAGYSGKDALARCSSAIRERGKP